MSLFRTKPIDQLVAEGSDDGHGLKRELTAVDLIARSPAMTGTVITIDGGLALANPGRDVAFLTPGSR